jgi:hypothetical protein
MTALVWVMAAVGVVLAITCFQRPLAEWHLAHRERSFWVMMLAIPGVSTISVPVYVLTVLPRFPQNAGADVKFLKEPPR